MRLMQETDRPDLYRMLEESDDFPQYLLDLYQRGRGRNGDATFVASRGGEIDGVLTGSFHSDLAQSGAFDSFELPPAPHAFLARIYVRRSARCLGTGRALTGAYATEASERGCTFIGGSLDLASEPRARRAFFERLGFTIRDPDNFGARPADVLATSANR